MTLARDMADFAISADENLSNRNIIYNGAMQVHQRGTSTASITAGGYYTADRWYFNAASLGTWTQSVESDAPTGSGLRKSLKVLATTADAAPAASDQAYVQQLFEGQDVQRFAKGTANAQQLTLSFWVKANVTGTYVATLFDHDNTRSVSASYSVSESATWEKKTIMFPADTTGALDNDNALSLSVAFWLAAGSNFTSGTLATTWGVYTAANYVAGQTNLAAATNNYWQVTGVQLEVGPVATPFEFKSFGQELRECLRYYQRFYVGFALGFADTTTGGIHTIYYPVVMRIAPTALETSGTASNYNVKLSANTITCSAIPSFGGASNSSILISSTVSSGFTAGNGLRLNVGATAYLGWSAEL